MVGFASNAVLGVAGAVIDAVKKGQIKHFFLVGGCDGAKPGRSYYTEFVEKAPKDTVVLTLACGKFRFFDKDLGDIGGIPRLLDIGQCNDAYSAVVIAQAFAKAFGVGLNELPLSMILSWYEQKACCDLAVAAVLGRKKHPLRTKLARVHHTKRAESARRQLQHHANQNSRRRPQSNTWLKHFTKPNTFSPLFNPEEILKTMKLKD